MFLDHTVFTDIQLVLHYLSLLKSWKVLGSMYSRKGVLFAGQYAKRSWGTY